MLLGMVGTVLATRGVEQAGSQMVNGLQQGAIYALVAIGYTMVYGIIELINFAHGDVFTLGAFYTIIVSNWLASSAHIDLTALAAANGLGLVVALAVSFVVAMLLTGLTGIAIERIAYRRLRDAPRLAPLITAIGVSFLLQGIMFVNMGPGNVETGNDLWIRGIAFSFGQVVVEWKDVFVLATAVTLMVALQLFVNRSRLGRAMRATAQDRDAALLSGININRTIAATFFIGSALAGAAAVIYGIYYGLVQFNRGYQFGIIAFTAAVLGGIGNIVGAGVGGFLIGVIAVFGGVLLGGEWSNSLVFVMLIVVLTLRPTGLLGSRIADRA